MDIPLTDLQHDILKEAINMGVCNGANALNTMTNSHIDLHVPCLAILPFSEGQKEMQKLSHSRLSVVNLSFSGDFIGNAELAFPAADASKLVAIFSDGDTDADDYTSIYSGTLCEVGNVVLNSVVGSISNFLGLSFKYAVPNYIEMSADTRSPSGDYSSSAVILLGIAQFCIKELNIDGNIILFLEMDSIDKLLTAIDSRCPIEEICHA